MAIWNLDISYANDENDFYQTTELDGRLYLFRFTWNTRDLAWRISAYQPDGTPLALSRKIVLNVSLFGGETDERLPPGALFVVDPTGSNVDAAHDDLGSRVPLIYADADEIANPV